MEEQKINFLYPNSPASSSLTQQQQQQQQQQANFSPTAALEPVLIGLPSFTAQRQQVSLTQIYPSRKIKHVKHSGFRKRSCSNSMPYYIPFRNRQRTKSENQDNNCTPPLNQLSMECDNFQMDTEYISQQASAASNTSQFNKIKLVQLKKSKSLESLCSTKEGKKEKEQNYSTMEFFDLNHQIQKLNLVHD